MMMYIIIGIACLVGIIVVVLLLPNSGKQQQKGQKYRFELSAGGGRKITFAHPFDNFLVYGGANSGKTKSKGKPLLSQYIQAGFAGFVYNYKDFDLARTAVHLVKKHNYPYGCFQISFTDMERTHRTNPIRPSVVKNETLFLQLMDDMLTAYQGKDGKRDEWFNGALGILRGVSIRFYNDYPQFCTIPHIVNFICSDNVVPGGQAPEPGTGRGIPGRKGQPQDAKQLSKQPYQQSKHARQRKKGVLCPFRK